MEADIYPLLAPELADLIDGAIGGLSSFPTTLAIMPRALGRRLRSCQADGSSASCACKRPPPMDGWLRLDPLDLFVSKACAAREKDIDFNRAMLRHGIVTLNAALERAQELDHPTEVQRVTAWIRRLALNAGS